MNTNTITKLLTAVMFVVVSGFVKPVVATESTSPSIVLGGSKSDAELKQEERREADAACKEAQEEYKKGRDDAAGACESVVGADTSSKSRSSRADKKIDKKKACEDKIKQCEAMAAQTSSVSPISEDRDWQTYEIIRDAITEKDPEILARFGGAQAVAGGSCLVEVDSKEAQDIEKDRRDRRKDLKKDIEKIEDDAIKDKEDNDKELTRITKEIQELKRNNKETAAKADAKMSEELTQSQKDLVDSNVRIRKLTTDLTKKNDAVRAINFSFADKMLDTSTQKQNLRCKAVLETAKDCMIKSVKNQPKPDICKEFPVNIRSKGPKATAELKAQLKVVNEACYEKESRDLKKTQFDQQETLKRTNDEISELQSQLRDESERQRIQSQRSQQIREEAQREKNEADANLAEQISTLQNEQFQFSQKLQSKMIRSQERLQKLQQELAELEMEERTGRKSKTRLASRSVQKTKSALEDVKYQCQCEDNFDAKPEATKYGRGVCLTTKGTIPAGMSSPSQSGSSKPKTSK